MHSQENWTFGFHYIDAVKRLFQKYIFNTKLSTQQFKAIIKVKILQENHGITPIKLYARYCK